MTTPSIAPKGLLQSLLASRLLTFRPQLSPLTLKLLVAAFLLVTANATFWSRYLALMSDRPLMMAGGGVIAFAAILFCISFITLPWLVRPMLALALIVGAVASYFQDRLGVVIDRDMLQNALNTTGNESRHLLTAGLFAHITLFGLIPAAFVLWVKTRPMRWWRQVLHYPLALAIGLGLFFGAMSTDYKAFSSMLRERRDVTSAILPATPIIAAVRMAKLKLRNRSIVAQPIGPDAHKGVRITAEKKPVLTLIVIGETSRAANWSLGGYTRTTNPELAARDIAYVDRVQSCGTSTAVSMPCMFAHYGMDAHSDRAARSHQNLLDLFRQTGFDVQWFDNNTGSLGVAARVPETRFAPADDPENCGRGECTDMVFLPTLDRFLATMTEDTVLVYHQIGSHGPAYYLRYPDQFRPFADDCRSADFGKCTPAQIVDAYDNSIAFTDHFLATLIDRMGAQDRVITSMLYVSDHGESLGEGGLYLHAAPYFMAPDVQTQVPLVLWTGPAYRQAFGVDGNCVDAKAHSGAGKISHDAVFHTALGLADVETSLHNPALDLLDGCHGNRAVAASLSPAPATASLH